MTSMSGITYALIINVKSRKSRDWLKTIMAAFERYGIDLARVHVVKTKQEIKEVLEAEARAEPDVLIIGGGDGTIVSAINHIIGTNIRLAVLPLGTTNNFARSLNLPTMNIAKSVKIIADGKRKKIALGWDNGHYFTNLSAIGLTTQMAANVSDRNKRFFGQTAYYVQGFIELLRHRPFECTITVDSQKPLHLVTHQLVVANGKYHGPVRMRTKTSIDKGEISVIIFGRNKKRLVVLKNIIYFVIPSWVRMQPLALVGKNIKITTSPTRSVEVDGEVVSQTPATFKVKNNAVEVFYRP